MINYTSLTLDICFATSAFTPNIVLMWEVFDERREIIYTRLVLGQEQYSQNLTQVISGAHLQVSHDTEYDMSVNMDIE
jgi:hypothetical protein